MFPVNFEKARTARFVQALANGEPIGAVENADDMLALAGACFFAVLSNGEQLSQIAAKVAAQGLPEPIEHAESDQQMARIIGDVHAAVEFVANLTQSVYHDEYDASFDATVQALVNRSSGQLTVYPLMGFKDAP